LNRQKTAVSGDCASGEKVRKTELGRVASRKKKEKWRKVQTKRETFNGED